VIIRPPAELAAARDGRVRKEGSRLVLDFTRARAEELAERRGRVGAGRVRSAVKRLLALPPRNPRPGHRVLRPFAEGKLCYYRFALETEPGIQAIVTMPWDRYNLLGVPPGKRCVLLVPHQGAFEDLASPALRRLLSGERIFAVDPRGIGESTSAACGNRHFTEPYDCDYFYHAHGVMLGEPYAGRRVHDVLCTMDWLASLGYRDIHLVGRGIGAVTALLAATVAPRPRHVTLVNALLSYHELTQVPMYAWPASSMVRGALTAFDLPDCMAALGGRLTLIAPWDARQRPIPPRLAARRIRELGLRRSVLKVGAPCPAKFPPPESR
jgi:pimeloyl-ACP methyl ester carboxylesterase